VVPDVIANADALNCYGEWPDPRVIVSDGAYGVGGFPTDTPDPSQLRSWYEPHVAAWARHATPATTLWFWNTERGWAEVHPVLEDHGWAYRGANVWNKGIQHVSGNTNTQTIRTFPKVTEMCVQYTRSKASILGLEDDPRDVQQWMRDEWQRAGLPFQAANDACNVAAAATRKWFAADDKWYFPPPGEFERLREYANQHGDEAGKPYFDAEALPPDHREMFDCPGGVTNVWECPPLHGAERVDLPDGVTHPNQKPKTLMERIVSASTSPGDVVWEPFGGMCTVTVVAENMDREAYAAEIDDTYATEARNRYAREV
jgi:site-specific DNA-methyltransferase (adenine-specific)